MSIHQKQEAAALLRDLLEASKSAERLIGALFEVGALEGEPFMSIWCHLDKAIDRTQQAIGPGPDAPTGHTLTAA